MVDKSKDIEFMALAVALARRGLGTVSPNPVVGAVIVGAGGVVLGEGFHMEYGGPHAEVNAVNSVGDRALLRGATMYVTLEPCSHYGQTPPCADLLVDCGFARVVIGCVDPYKEVQGRGIRRLQGAGIEVDVGVLEGECWHVNRRFMTAQERGRPWVMLKWAQSLDGYLDAERPAVVPPAWFTGPYAQQIVHQWRAQNDAIMVGRRTVELDNPQLTVRCAQGRNPVRVVVSSSMVPTAAYRVFDNAAETLVVSGSVGDVLAQLHRQNIQSVIVEGGAKLLEAFVQADLWDEARVFTAAYNLAHYYPGLPEIIGVSAPQLSPKMEVRRGYCRGPVAQCAATPPAPEPSPLLQIFRRR